MMNNIEKVEIILNNVLELYNFEMGMDCTFEKVDIEQDEFCNYAFGVVKEMPFLYFSVYISTISDYFNIEIFTFKGLTDRATIFSFKNPF